MNQTELHTLGIDIGSTTVKIAVLDSNNDVLFSDYERHFANIQETLSALLGRAIYKLGQIKVSPMVVLLWQSILAYLLSRRLLPFPPLFRIMHHRPM